MSPGEGETFVREQNMEATGAGSGQLGAVSMISKWCVRGRKRKAEQTGVWGLWNAQGRDGDSFPVLIWWSKPAL